MAQKLKGITIEINGDTTGLTKALSKVNSNVKDTQYQLKRVERLLKLNPDDTELLAQKQKLLGDKVRYTAEQMEYLQKALEDTKNLSEEQTTELKLQWEEVTAANKRATEELESMKSVLGQISEDAKLLSDDFGKVSKSTKKISAAAAAITGFSVKSAMDLEATEAKYKTVFAGMTEAADEFIEDFKKLTPATTAEARSMASGIQDLLIPMGFVREQATDMTGEFMNVIGALTNFNSATEDAESVAAKISSALTGQYDSLKSLGIQLDSNTVKQKAVDMGLASSTSEVNKQHMALVLLQEVYSQSGDALAAYNEQSLDAKTKLSMLRSEISDSTAELGESLLPIINEFLSSLKNVLDSFNKLDPKTQELIAKILLAVAAISPLAKGVSVTTSAASKLSLGFGKLVSKVGTFMETMDPVYLKFAKWALVITAVVTAITLLIAAIATLTGKSKDLQNTFNSVGAAGNIGGMTPALAGSGSIPMMASGGVLSSGSAIVGEAGPEILTMMGSRAVVTPLTATVDSGSMASAMRQAGVGGGGDIDVNVNIKYEGDLAQVGRVLQPAIAVEAARRGENFSGR